jgi:hypothetical protein
MHFRKQWKGLRERQRVIEKGGDVVVRIPEHDALAVI